MSLPEFHIIVPARYQSTRLPGKPLADIAGKPMIRHVVEQCQLSNAQSVTVATDDQRVFEVVKGFGAAAVMTSSEHISGSDRIAEACMMLKLPDEKLVINVQGDEPDMPVSLIHQVAEALANHPEAKMVTAKTSFDHPEQYHQPDIVKVVTGANDIALYFSRANIPFSCDADDESNSSMVARHIGIYGYRAGYIQHFTKQPVCELEKREKLEQLRALYYGDKVVCVQSREKPGVGIDTPFDLERARKKLRSC